MGGLIDGWMGDQMTYIQNKSTWSMSGGSETYFGLNLDPDIIRWEPKKGLELLNQNFFNHSIQSDIYKLYTLAVYNDKILLSLISINFNFNFHLKFQFRIFFIFYLNF